MLIFVTVWRSEIIKSLSRRREFSFGIRVPIAQTYEVHRMLKQEPEGVLWTKGRVLRSSLPVLVELVVQMVTQLIDMAMVGRLGVSAIAAMGLANLSLMVGQGVLTGISIGAMALVARYIGAEEEGLAKRVNHQSLLVSGALAALLCLFMFVHARHIISILSTESEVVVLGASYLRHILPGFAVFLTTIPLGGALRGAGDAVTPMKISIVLHVVKLIGNWVLIYGKMGCPALALDGAAISWTLSRAIAGLLFLYTLRDPACPVSISPIAAMDFLRIDTIVAKRLLRIAVPAILEQVALSLGMVVYGSMVAGLGTAVYAAFNIANTTESLSYMPGQSFQTATSATVGHYLGAGEYGGAKRSVKEATKICVATMGTMALAFLLVPQYLVQMFTADPEIIRLSSMALRVAAFGQVPMGLAGICSGGLQGAGDTQAVMYVTLFSVWVVRLGVTYLLVNVGGLGLPGAWLAQVVDWLVRCGCLWYRFRLSQWEQVEV